VISLLPNYQETLVLPLAIEEISIRIKEALLHDPTNGKVATFTGWIENDRFRISIHQRRPSNYIPVVSGKMESTSRGTIVFATYRLLPNVRMFLLLWTLLLVIGSIAIGYQYHNSSYSLAGFAFLAFIHWIVRANFKLQIKPTQEKLLTLFT
jgi:hypothetical protein